MILTQKHPSPQNDLYKVETQTQFEVQDGGVLTGIKFVSTLLGGRF